MKPLSVDLAETITKGDFSDHTVTVVGYGNMGRQYVEALQRLKVGKIVVCSRSPEPLNELKNVSAVEVIGDGLEGLFGRVSEKELVVVSTPPDVLVSVSEELLNFGYRRMLIEKPVSLKADEIFRLDKSAERLDVLAVCGFNRVAFPSFVEVLGLCSREGGVTSFNYEFTELVKSDWTDRFPPQELARWGVANSMHVLSMAHGLGGFPLEWKSHRTGMLKWHPSGSIFVGSGISENGAAFSYHADWGSKGRWSVEVKTSESSYKLCPLERVFRKISGTGDYEEIPVTVFAPDIKPGLLEQVAAMLDDKTRTYVPLMSLNDAARLTQYAQSVFGYSEE